MTNTSITKRDLYLFCLDGLAAATWSNTRRFQGETMPQLVQNVTSLCRRGLGLGWTDREGHGPGVRVAGASPCAGRHRGGPSGLPGDGTEYSNRYVKEWTAKHGHEAEERATKHAARPSSRILEYAVNRPNELLTAGLMADTFEISVNTAAQTMRRLVARHELERVRHGVYRLFRAPVPQSIAELEAELEELERRLHDAWSHNREVREENAPALRMHAEECRYCDKFGLPRPKLTGIVRCKPTSRLMDAITDVAEEIYYLKYDEIRSELIDRLGESIGIAIPF